MCTVRHRRRAGHAFYGSALMSGIVLLIGTLIGTPIGLMAGIWLTEFARHSHLGTTVRFINDILRVFTA